ncbi:MAG: flagellar basal body L-ring protein FlgH [Spiribacter salinus]|uniref:Flagellar L-ring protein n=2 Tax=Pseudomonadota TaxID=1224 RepID=A0A540VVR6_9GAMM|nr:MAG: flagellar basal body L-ring protein FlgH [Spiribacter salinus]
MKARMMKAKTIALPALLCLAAACGRSDHIGKPPSFTEGRGNQEHGAMMSPGLPKTLERKTGREQASLWNKGRDSLLGDQRAMKKGDILTVVIEIDDKAEISNSTSRGRSGTENLSIGGLFGIPQRIDEGLPDGASMEEAVGITSSSQSDGDGNVRRNEKLTLRIAATILDELPNGVLYLAGSQEVRVNFEMRELLVTGFVRPADISRQNEINYDKIASARISYGGRGQISDMQQPRVGQQVLDLMLPF